MKKIIAEFIMSQFAMCFIWIGLFLIYDLISKPETITWFELLMSGIVSRVFGDKVTELCLKAVKEE